jgi:membrane AbrB-like protein
MARLARLLCGAAAGAALCGALQVPAATLVGSVVGGALTARLAPMPPVRRSLVTATRTVGLVLIGTSAGARIGEGTLTTLWRLALPLLGGIVLLLVLNLALAVLLITRYGVGPVTAVLACAPGGVSAIAVTARELGARMSVVLAVHMARVLTVVLLVLPILVACLGPA